MSLLNTLETSYAMGIIMAAALVLVALRRWTSQGSPHHLPPGPNPLPIIGNLFDIPREKEWLTYHEWNQKYGEVVYAEALGQKIIVLGTADAANDLMERRSAVYSDRSVSMMMSEIMDFKWLLTIIPYGEAWRQQRKLMHPYFHVGAVPQYGQTQLESARRFIRDLLASLQTPEALPLAVRTNFAEAITKIIYGINLAKDPSNEYIHLTERVLDAIGVATLPGRFLVDYVPLLRFVPSWMPGAGFKKYARETVALHTRMREMPADKVKGQMEKGEAPQSVVRSMLEDMVARASGRSSSKDEQMIKDLAAQMYLGGSETTVSSVLSFFLAMAVYPEVQRKAQDEIDRVVGVDRLPELADEADLPYVSGVINECLRWLPVGPMGVPHAASRDDEYKGYFIPKGTIVMGSAWAILHNPTDYPDPDTFNPERYLLRNPDGTLSRNPNIRDPRTAAFGFGRRTCPGRFFADVSLFATVSTVLATLNVGRAKDADGRERMPTVDVTSGLLSHPKPFEYTLSPRSDKALRLLAVALDH